MGTMHVSLQTEFHRQHGQRLLLARSVIISSTHRRTCKLHPVTLSLLGSSVFLRASTSINTKPLCCSESLEPYESELSLSRTSINTTPLCCSESLVPSKSELSLPLDPLRPASVSLIPIRRWVPSSFRKHTDVSRTANPRPAKRVASSMYMSTRGQ